MEYIKLDDMVRQIDALVGNRLTAQKAAMIRVREGYVVTGVVLTRPDGRACLVNHAAVRWLHGQRDLTDLMHSDTGVNQRLVADAVAAEREACAQVCEANSHPCREFIDQASICAAAIRARAVKGAM